MKLQKKNVAYTEVGEIPGNLPSLQLPTQQAGGTLKKTNQQQKIQLIILFGSWFGLGNGSWKFMALDLQKLNKRFNWQLSTYWEKQTSCSCWQIEFVQRYPKKGIHVDLLIPGRISVLHKFLSEE